jgi:hypothetical protein
MAVSRHARKWLRKDYVFLKLGYVKNVAVLSETLFFVCKYVY